jgi:hypothetical protein
MGLKMIVTSCAVLSLLLALPPAYGEMMQKDQEMMGKEGMMEEKRMAMFTGAGSHKAEGTAQIGQDMKGRPVLILELKAVDKVPDGRVYLAKDGDYTKGVELGKLTQFMGKVEYAIPAKVNPHDYNSVVIWCKKFNTEIGHAFFKEAMMDKGMMMDDKKGGMDNGMMGKDKEMMK